MTLQRLDVLSRQPFYLSHPQKCPYLEGLAMKQIVTRLGDARDDDRLKLFSDLTAAGFRRSHDQVYRPACDACAACVPVRVVVGDFSPTKTQRRLLKKFPPARWEDKINEDEHYALFMRYQRARHAEGDMAAMTRHEFSQLAGSYGIHTRILCLRDDDKNLLAAMIVDVVDDGLSAVYSYYQPHDAGKGLGTALIVQLIRCAADAGKDFIYLGYWIKESKKMAYKSSFRPLQHLTGSGWQNLDKV